MKIRVLYILHFVIILLYLFLTIFIACKIDACDNIVLSVVKLFNLKFLVLVYTIEVVLKS